MRLRSTALTLVLAVATAPAQEAAPDLGTAAPLESPRAPTALRGIAVQVEVETTPSGHAVRTANYLARLCEGAGGRVALLLDPTLHAADEAAGLGRPFVRIQVRESDVPAASAGAGFADKLAAVDPAAEQAAVLAADVGAPPAGDSGSAVQPTAHRPATHRLFEALIAFAREHGEALRARGAGNRSDTKGLNRLWPHARPPQTSEEVAVVLDNWRSTTAVDRSQVYLDVRVLPGESRDSWVLEGATELPMLEDAVVRTLASVGLRNVSGTLRILPDLSRLDGPPYGIVSGPAVVTWRHPGATTGNRDVDPRGQVEETELRTGEPVRLLDRQNGFVLTHALSGYVGWARESSIDRCDSGVFASTVETWTLDGDRSAPTGTATAQVALARLGTPYVFGGRSSLGIDCSGLAETSWSTQGVFLPRDAGQQILAGALVSTRTRPAPLVPGDLLFFANASGRISHVAVSLGGFRFVHATPPEVTVASLDPTDPYYAPVAERFVLAKRVAR
jgi:hypothetical protein